MNSHVPDVLDDELLELDELLDVELLEEELLELDELLEELLDVDELLDDCGETPGCGQTSRTLPFPLAASQAVPTILEPVGPTLPSAAA